MGRQMGGQKINLRLDPATREAMERCIGERSARGERGLTRNRWLHEAVEHYITIHGGGIEEWVHPDLRPEPRSPHTPLT